MSKSTAVNKERPRQIVHRTRGVRHGAITRDHTVAWIALSTGSLTVPERVEAGELVVFESSDKAIDFYAEADTEFVLGSAASHPYVLALGKYSVHTSHATLRAGERRIVEIRSRLQEEGRL
jgi:hypothetical protein